MNTKIGVLGELLNENAPTGHQRIAWGASPMTRVNVDSSPERAAEIKIWHNHYQRFILISFLAPKTEEIGLMIK
jgi:hypothetical protein